MGTERVRDDVVDIKGKSRLANLELLRCVAMMMVVVLHYLGKGELLADLSVENMGSVGIAAWVLECFCIVAVNLYMLISGYFLCESSFKLSRLLRLLVQIWTYSAGIGLLSVALGLVPAEEFTTYYLLQLIFPVSMGHYWFMTAYVFLYLLLPLVSMAVKRMTKGQLQITLGLLLIAFCLMKSVLPVRLEMDAKGYDCLWYLCVFLTAAYIRKFGISFLQKRGRGLILYVVSALLIFVGTMCLHFVYVKTGSMGLIIKVFIEYNHVLPLLAAVGLFVAFLKLKVPKKAGKYICLVAPYTLGVYLLHENIGVRYLWQRWLGAECISGVGELVLWTVTAVAVVFTAGVLAEAIRVFLMKWLHKGLMHIGWYQSICGQIDRADRQFVATDSIERSC